MPHRLERVGGLAGLGDGNDKRVLIQNRVAVAEFAGQLDLDGQPGPVLDRVLGQQPGVVRGTACDDEHLVDLAQLLVGEPLLVEHDAAVDEVTEQGVGDGGWLLGDLLEHEVVVAALFGGRCVPVDMKSPSTCVIRFAVEVGDAVAVGRDHHGLVLAELDGVAGVLDERGHIGADEHLAVTDSKHQRRGAAGGDDRARFVGVGEDQSEVAVEPAQHGQHRRRKVSCGVAVVVLLGDQMDGHLGVGVARELDACGFQLAAQHRVVLDDAVVDDGDLSGGVAVRVCVAIGRPAVSGPARVAEARAADEAGGLGFAERGFQVGQPAGPATHRQPATAIQQCDPRRVVSSVLHPAQRIDHNIAGRALPDVADDSTHRRRG